MNRAEKVPGGLIISRRDRAILLELREEVLNQMPRRVQMPVEYPWRLPVGFWRNNRLFSRSCQRFEHPLRRINRLIGQQHVRPHLWQQNVRAFKVMGLASGQMEAYEVPQSVNQRVNFRAQLAPGPADRLVFAAFF